ncbi:MAG: hypothetical protein H7Z41_03240 [Cytophagales bacterium]|nr:hypothetical protein [Armatimonadota bacterium]
MQSLPTLPTATAPTAAAASQRSDGPFMPADSPQRATKETVLLAWRTHRLRENPRLLGLVMMAYGVALLLWLFLFPHPLTLILPLGALTSAMAEYLFPVSYRLTTRGARASCFLTHLSLDWSEVKRARYGEDGAFLSPFARASRLDQFRGIRLRFAEGNEEAVLETVRRCRREFHASGEPETA